MEIQKISARRLIKKFLTKNGKDNKFANGSFKHSSKCAVLRFNF